MFDLWLKKEGKESKLKMNSENSPIVELIVVGLGSGEFVDLGFKTF